MESIINIEDAKRKVLDDMNTLIVNVRKQTSENLSTLKQGLSILRNIRLAVYENLNQIQHEYLILEGLLWVNKKNIVPIDTKWYWNPRQTGISTEPDLRGVYNRKIILSAEATTSENPQGVIDSRMRDTLAKLNEMEGTKFYFIRSSAMELRAKTKISKNGWNISVIKFKRLNIWLWFILTRQILKKFPKSSANLSTPTR